MTRTAEQSGEREPSIKRDLRSWFVGGGSVTPLFGVSTRFVRSLGLD
jgi:hypothetical protein